MTIYTHAVVGVGLATIFIQRPMPRLFWVLAAFLPILPDLDAFSWATYGTLWGHRGFTHSLTFALGLGLIAAGLTCRFFRANFWTLSGVFFVLTASHSLLDAFTRGGAGIPFFWPLTAQRFGGWGPVLVSDVGFEWPNPFVSRSLQGELLWVWLPVGTLVGMISAYRRYYLSPKEVDDRKK